MKNYRLASAVGVLGTSLCFASSARADECYLDRTDYNYVTNENNDGGAISGTDNNGDGDNTDGGEIKNLDAALACGVQAKALNNNAVAVGYQATASAPVGATALGGQSSATGSNSVALGSLSRATEVNTVSIGYAESSPGAGDGFTRRIVNVSDGIDDTDAATVGQMNSAISTATANLVSQDDLFDINNSISELNDTTFSNSLGVANNTAAINNLTPAVVANQNELLFFAASTNSTDGTTPASTSAEDAVAIGNGAKAQAFNSVALGANSIADSTNTVSVGSFGNERRITNVATPINATDAANKAYVDSYNAATQANTAELKYFAVSSTGAAATATGTDALSAGANARASGDRTTAVGGNSLAVGGNGGSAFGYNAWATSTNATAFGVGTRATGSGSAALGQNATSSGNRTTAVGRLATASDTQATAVGNQATASRLNSTAVGSLANVAHRYSTAIGYAATTTADNQVMLGGAGSSVVIADIDASTAAQQGPVDVVTIDANGTLGKQQVASAAEVANVRASMDHIAAVTDAQFDALSGRVGVIEGQVASLFDLTATIDKDAQRGIASIAAAANPHFPSEDGKTSYASNVAMYRGEFGVSAGLMHRVTAGFAVTAGVSYAGGNSTAVKAGVAGEF